MHQLVERRQQSRLTLDGRLRARPGRPLTIRRLDPARTSRVAVFTVDELIFDASTTRAWPPRPNASTTTRRWRSSRWGITVAKNPASPSPDNSTPQHYTSRVILWWTLTGELR